MRSESQQFMFLIPKKFFSARDLSVMIVFALSLFPLLIFGLYAAPVLPKKKISALKKNLYCISAVNCLSLT